MTVADKKSILIIDDDAELRKQVHMSLALAIPDALIIEAENGSQALVKIRNQRFDLLITDLMMPKMDGKTLLQSLTNIPKENKPQSIIVLSGHVSPEQQQTSLGTVTFISKPVDPPQFKEAVRQALGIKAAGKKTGAPKVDAAFIIPFIEGAFTVLNTTANIQAKKESVFVRGKGQVSGDISAIIPINSQTYLGSMALSFEKACFLHVVSNMLGENFTEITSENQDAAAEICNQIFGYAKRVLNEAGHTIKAAIPSIVVGDGHSIKHPIEGVCIAVKLTTEKGCFTIETVIH